MSPSPLTPKRRSMAGSAAALIVMFVLGVGSAYSNSFIVTSRDDAGTHSLRWAIMQANVTPGPDVISFNIPGDGPHTILLLSALPALIDDAGVVIDGLTQPGTSTGTTPPSSMQLVIQVDGIHAGETPGLILKSSNNVVQGIVLMRFALEGIRIQATPFSTTDNIIRYCIIGATVDGTTRAANASLANSSFPAGIGLVSPADEAGDISGNTVLSCLISGNSGDGILLLGEGGVIKNNSIRGNYIGVSRMGACALGNTGNGVAMLGQCASNEINGNIIGGNHLNGIRIAGTLERFSQRNTISHNTIGVGTDRISIGNGRDGINIGSPDQSIFEGFARNNVINGNIIATNERNGITIREHAATTSNADGNRISSNSIYCNRKIGIDLNDDGVSLNDINDVDEGANRQINVPTILTAEMSGGVAIIQGTMDRRDDDARYTLEVFRYRGNDSRTAQGSLFLGSMIPGGNGNWAFTSSGVLMEGDSIVATLIDAAGNTSEFSHVRPVLANSFVEVRNPGATEMETNPTVVTILSVEPNPVLEYTEISLNAERDTWAIVQVYTPSGELVETVLDRWIQKGEHLVKWDVENWKGVRVTPGWYVCLVDADGGRTRHEFEVGDVSFGAKQ